MPHGIREVVGGTLGLALLLLVLFAVDERIRPLVWQFGRDVLNTRWSRLPSVLSAAVVDGVHGYGIQGELLATFLAVTLVLVWLMLRS